MKFSCCIEMLFTEVEFIKRFEKAREAGFEYVEFWNWDNKDIPAVKKALADTGLKMAAFQGNSQGRMVDKNDRQLYLDGVKKGIEIAHELGVMNAFVMSDILQEDRTVLPMANPISDEEKTETTIEVLREIAPMAEAAGVTMVIEPLNTFVDHKGYSLCHTAPAVEILKAVNSPNVKLLYDAYHMQIMEGNICENIKAYHDYFGHFHIADVPGRCQPGTGELNYLHILRTLESTGYDRIVGWEFEPRGGSSEEVVKATFDLFKTL